MEFNATFLITAISFIAFVLIMNVILYRPLEKIVDERQKLIKTYYLDSDNAQTEAKSLLEKKAQTIAKAKYDAKNSIDLKVKDGYNKSSDRLKDEKGKSLRYIAEQKEMLHSVSDQAEANLDEHVYNFAQMIKDKLFGVNK